MTSAGLHVSVSAQVHKSLAPLARLMKKSPAVTFDWKTKASLPKANSDCFAILVYNDDAF